MRGTFIVMEGPDGSGTTLHARLLKERLISEGQMVIATFEPTDGPIGLSIREKLHNREATTPLELQQLFCEDRAWHIEHVIEPALRNGTTVISDRYIPSTLAYGQALGIPLKKLKDMNKDFIQPDWVFFLLPPLKVCIERMAQRDKHDALEEESLQRKVYANYRHMAEEDASVHVIDTSGPKTAVAAEISSHIQNT